MTVTVGAPADGASAETEPSDRAAGHWTTDARICLLGLLALALALRVVVLVMLPNLHHADEIYQALEQAHRLVSGYGTVPWEFEAGIRSWILPGVLALPIWLGGQVSSDPAVPALLAGILLAILSLTIVAAAFTAGLRSSLGHAVVAGFVAAIWVDLVHHAGRTLTEMVATAPLLAALALAAKPVLRRRELVVVGLLLGACLGLRFHLAPGVAVVAAWLLWTHGRRAIAPLVIGGLVPLAIVGLVDWVTWGVPFTSILRNLQINVLEGKASEFGVSPIGEYLRTTWASWGLLVPVIGLLALAGARRLPAWLLTAAAILVSHSLLSHKEPRFIFPALAILVVLAAVGSVEVMGAIVRRLPPARAVLPLALAIVLIGWTGVTLAVGRSGHWERRWVSGSERIAAFHWLHHVPELCGVGLQEVQDWEVPGYVHLRRDVPIIESEGGPFTADAVNAVLAWDPVQPPDPSRWQAVARFGRPDRLLVIWTRDGGCAADAG